MLSYAPLSIIRLWAVAKRRWSTHIPSNSVCFVVFFCKSSNLSFLRGLKRNPSLSWAALPHIRLFSNTVAHTVQAFVSACHELLYLLEEFCRLWADPAIDAINKLLVGVEKWSWVLLTTIYSLRKDSTLSVGEVCAVTFNCIHAYRLANYG